MDRKLELKYIERPHGLFIDRKAKEPESEPIDVIMMTLDADNFLEKCLYTLYSEIPVRKLFVGDGGSKDKTAEIIKKFPRVEFFVRPDIRTTGKTLEFLISKIETEWAVIIDADIELLPGWYDEMCKYQTSYDVIENSRRIMAYHMYREDENKLKMNQRPGDWCTLMRKEAVQNYTCDDDYMQRFTDWHFRQVVDNSGYRYGKISNATHVHNETERIPYESDNEKNFRKIVWTEPSYIITDKNKMERLNIKHSKAIVKYLDPNHFLANGNKGIDSRLRLLDRKWIEENGPKWLQRYDRTSSKIFQIKNFCYRCVRSLRRKSPINKIS